MLILMLCFRVHALSLSQVHSSGLNLDRMDKLSNRAVQRRTSCLTDSECFIPGGDQVEMQKNGFEYQIGDLSK